jgi:hypothetical protein
MTVLTSLLLLPRRSCRDTGPRHWPRWPNTLAQHAGPTRWPNTPAQHAGPTRWPDTPARHAGPTHRPDTPARHTGPTHAAPILGCRVRAVGAGTGRLTQYVRHSLLMQIMQRPGRARQPSALRHWGPGHAVRPKRCARRRAYATGPGARGGQELYRPASMACDAGPALPQILPA